MNDRFDWQALQKDVTDVQRPLAEDAELLRKTRARLMLASRGISRRVPVKRWSKAWPVLAAAALIALGVGFFAHRPSSALSFRTGSGWLRRAAWCCAVSQRSRVAADSLFGRNALVLVAATSRARVLKTSSLGRGHRPRTRPRSVWPWFTAMAGIAAGRCGSVHRARNRHQVRCRVERGRADLHAHPA